MLLISGIKSGLNHLMFIENRFKYLQGNAIYCGDVCNYLVQQVNRQR